MAASTTLLQFLLMLLAGWLQRQQAATIDYLQAENRILRARLRGRRMIFTDAERRQLAEKARALGREGLRELGTIVTPETLLRWHRELVARKWTLVERRRPGRPRTRGELAALVVRMSRPAFAGVECRSSRGANYCGPHTLIQAWASQTSFRPKDGTDDQRPGSGLIDGIPEITNVVRLPR